MKYICLKLTIFMSVIFMYGMSIFATDENIAPDIRLNLDWSFQDEEGERFLYLNFFSYASGIHREIRFIAADAESCYVGGSKGYVYKIDIKTGKNIWKTQVSGKAYRGYLYKDYLITFCADNDFTSFPVIPFAYNTKIKQGKSEYIVISTQTGKIEAIVPNTHKHFTGYHEMTVKLNKGKSMLLSELFLKSRYDSLSYIQDIERRKQNITDVSKWDEELFSSLFLEWFKQGVTARDFFITYCFCNPEEKKENGLSEQDSNNWLVKYSPAGQLMWKKPFDIVVYTKREIDDKLLLENDNQNPLAGNTQLIICVNKSDGKEIWRHTVKYDDRHGRQNLNIEPFMNYVALWAKNFERSDRPFRTGNGEELNLLLFNKETGHELLFKRFDAMNLNFYDKIIFTDKNIFVGGKNGTIYCYKIHTSLTKIPENKIK